MKSAPTSTRDLTDEERYRIFVSGVSDYAIYMLSPEGQVTSWNAGAERFKGYSSEEILGQHFSRFYTDADRAKNKPARALKTALETGNFEDEGWRVRKDGSHFWANVVMDPIYDEQGVHLGFVKITRDITERKRAEEALRASEEQFRLLVQSVTDYAIYMLSPSGLITNWNAGAERFKGYSADEVIGTHFSRFYTEQDLATNLPQRALEIAAKEGRFENEGLRVRKDGTRFWAHVVIDPIRNQLGELLGFAKITRDITEKREAAEALERAKEALFQSQKLEAIGKLTGGIAHDFNNLLSVVVNGIEILSGDLTSPAHAKVLESMKRAAKRGATLNQQLLSFARQQPLKQSKHDINSVILSFEAVLRRACNAAITFEILLAEGIRPVLIDPTQFESALLNLVTNAKDAMPEGGALTVSTEEVELTANEVTELDAGRYVRITVTDTGEGMPPEVVSQALDPFFTTKPVGKGTGMGLSQVYGIVQQFSGGLTIESKVGKGTAISLYLPALDESELDPAEDDSAEPDHPRAARDGSQDKRVLIVDDQPEVLEMAIALFQAMDYEVLSANNGADARDVLKRSRNIDLLFCDVVMPDINGVELAKEACRIHPNIQVLLTSGYPGETLREMGSDLNIFPLIHKPYSAVGLMRMLKKDHTRIQNI